MHQQITRMLSGGPPRQAVRDKAADRNIAIVEGTVIMGAPIGTDEHINTTVADLVDDLLHDLHTLKHFTTHGQWALLRMCINAGEAFERFDAGVTEKVLDIVAIIVQQQISSLSTGDFEKGVNDALHSEGHAASQAKRAKLRGSDGAGTQQQQ